MSRGRCSSARSRFRTRCRLGKSEKLLRSPRDDNECLMVGRLFPGGLNNDKVVPAAGSAPPRPRGPLPTRQKGIRRYFLCRKTIIEERSVHSPKPARCPPTLDKSGRLERYSVGFVRRDEEGRIEKGGNGENLTGTVCNSAPFVAIEALFSLPQCSRDVQRKKVERCRYYGISRGGECAEQKCKKRERRERNSNFSPLGAKSFISICKMRCVSETTAAN